MGRGSFCPGSKGGVGEAKTLETIASLYPAKLVKERGYDQILWLDGIYNNTSRKLVQ